MQAKPGEKLSRRSLFYVVLIFELNEKYHPFETNSVTNFSISLLLLRLKNWDLPPSHVTESRDLPVSLLQFCHN